MATENNGFVKGDKIIWRREAHSTTRETKGVFIRYINNEHSDAQRAYVEFPMNKTGRDVPADQLIRLNSI